MLWLALVSSRPVSLWFTLGDGGSQSNLEGNPINSVFNGALIIAAVFVLVKRKFSWNILYSRNKALILIYIYFLCSIVWSDFPVHTLRRLIQSAGCVLSGLILLTDNNPSIALRTVFARVSYFLFPLSIVFIKYFPEIGRVVSGVSGTHMVCGVTGHKNSLGEMTMVFCLILIWDLLDRENINTTCKTKPVLWTRIINLTAGIYLLVVSDCATALVCFLIGVALLFASNKLSHLKNPRKVIMMGAFCFTLLLGLEQIMGISDGIAQALGRDSTMTGRTDIWKVTLQTNTAHLLGNGFSVFWETKEGEMAWQELGTNRLVTAHSGYIESYLNGGIVALVLLLVMIGATGTVAVDKLVTQDLLGTVALPIWIMALVNNVTESIFFIPSPLWFTMLLMTTDLKSHKSDLGIE